MGSSKERVYTWAEIQPAATNGKSIVAIEGLAYDVTPWRSQHPGGNLVLEHHAGRDATDAFNAFHRNHARQIMQRYCIGRMESASPQPPSRATLAFRELASKVEAAGLMRTSRTFYLLTSMWCLALLVGAWWLTSAGYLVCGALAIALFWQQTAFIGHDGGHHAVTHHRKTDDAISLAVNASVGIGISWWNNTHNTHHCVVNSADCDPDIQFMPLVANSTLYFKSLFSRYHMHELTFDAAARRLISIQHFTFLPLLCVARYGLYLQGFQHILTGKRVYMNKWLELGAQVFFFVWYGTLVSCLPGGFLPRLAYVVISHAAFSLLHLQICLSHFSCRVFEGLPPPGQSWLETQVWGTMNWSCARWLDWLHGGLQYQIEHHLFPRMPRQNLRAASELVRPLCKELGLPYHSPSFPMAIVELLRSLRDTAMQAKTVELMH